MGTPSSHGVVFSGLSGLWSTAELLHQRFRVADPHTGTQPHTKRQSRSSRKGITVLVLLCLADMTDRGARADCSDRARHHDAHGKLGAVEVRWIAHSRGSEGKAAILRGYPLAAYSRALG